MTPALSKAFGAFIVAAGLEILSKVKSSMDEQTLSGFIDQVIALKNRTDAVLVDCLKERKSLKLEQSNAFKNFLNHEGASDRNAQLLAVYLNKELKQGVESKIEKNTETVLALFRSLYSSDVFEKTYTRQLANRLLSNKGTDLELEKQMAMAFKSETGESFSTLTDLMLTNVAESETLTESFKAVSPNTPFSDFNFKVLE